ncbi:CpsD/CapB family tyrosine-protein kinase [Desulfobacula phenolica]|uniref:non-specific protein-tyrosine kinase n=1 Tax=Desulfobacula phenolica TaxID=90732 RepID=A0A1H2DUY5_9BACT|nr:CpsD/CapB family tyrosine-protein kinase [Desulfobacula phenolica]SDT86238.1 capsular exopolysaccharide family [Desulfobacula phenolica]
MNVTNRQSELTKNFPEEKDNSPSDSFENRFKAIASSKKENIGNKQNRQSTYSNRYIQAAHIKKQNSNSDDNFLIDTHQSIDPVSKKSYQSKDSANNLKEPIFDYNSMNQGDKKSSSAWRFLNLKNKKQTGDLYKKILFFNKKNGFKAFNFISSRSKEGVSTVVANLVNYVASQTTTKKILVIDANLQSPKLHTIFNISNKAPDLVDVFNNRLGIRKAAIPITSNIFVLSCSKGKVKDFGNLEQENFVKLIDYCKQLYDYIFIDCPPVLSSSDALSVAPAADLTFLIIQSAQVQRPVLEKAKSLLQNDECQIGGVVLNRLQQVIPGWVYKFI